MPPSCEPGRCRGRASFMGHTPAPAELPSGRGRGLGHVGHCGLALNTLPSAQAPAPGRAARRPRGAFQVLQEGAHPAGCRQGRQHPYKHAATTVRRRKRPTRTSCLSSPAHSRRGARSLFAAAFTAASGAGLASCGVRPYPAWGSRNGRSFAPGAKMPWNLARFA